jgi:RimJ/RimL family protein N-acetyltransferase
MNIRLVTPFPVEHAELLWSWLMEKPEQSFNDFGPKNIRELAEQTIQRIIEGEIISEVLFDGTPVGAIGYNQVTEEIGVFRGIVFTESVHGTGVPFAAVSMVLDAVFKAGTQKVFARCFETNKQVAKFLKKLGARDEDLEAGTTICGGCVVAWKVVSIKYGDFVSRYPRLPASETIVNAGRPSVPGHSR